MIGKPASAGFLRFFDRDGNRPGAMRLRSMAVPQFPFVGLVANQRVRPISGCSPLSPLTTASDWLRSFTWRGRAPAGDREPTFTCCG